MLNLYTLIKSFKKGNEDAFEEILDIFKPLLNNLQRKNPYNDIYQELSIFLFEVLKKIPIHKDIFKEDKYIVSYITRSIKNHFIRINKKYSKITNYEISDEVTPLNDIHIDTHHIIFTDLLNTLTDLEKQIIKYKYLYLYSDMEISELQNVSRQYINKIRKNALKKLQKVVYD